MQAAPLEGGFAVPAIDAAHAFRAIMTAMARPGHIARIGGAAGPAPLSIAAAATLLTLCDADTPLTLGPSHDTAEIRAWIAFHTGAPLTGPAQAAFALGTWAELQPLDQYPKGTPEYPDRSTTLIVATDGLTAEGATLSGPGIKEAAQLSLPEVTAFQENARAYPLGLDFIFTAGSKVAALPRTTEVR